jgi:hypothetical protein
MRRLKKLDRRQKMAVMARYLSARETANGELVDVETNLSDCLRLIREAMKRCDETVTIRDLTRFVNDRIRPAIAIALRKVEFATSQIDEMRSDLTEIWADLKNRLTNLAIEMRMDSGLLASGMTYVVSNMKLSDQERLDAERRIMKRATVSDGLVTLILFGIAAFELGFYITFFFWKRNRTHGFKKMD